MTSPAIHTLSATPTLRCGLVETNGIRLYFQDEGRIGDPPLLLIMGLGCQLTVWPASLCQQLTAAGFRVIRFDNRDIGLSDAVNRGFRTDLARAMLRSRLRLPVQANYSLHDMVSDTLGLMDALGLPQAHVVGASMGGMIAQLLAALYPHRVLSLGSIMSSTNEPGLPLPRWDVMLLLNGWGVKKGHDKATAVARSLQFWRVIASPAFPTPAEVLQQRFAADFDRAYRPSGFLRQSQAIMATPGFSHLLQRIRCPVQVIHGMNDPLVPMQGGVATARAIGHAQLELIRGMGHDFPEQLMPRLVDLIVRNTLEA